MINLFLYRKETREGWTKNSQKNNSTDIFLYQIELRIFQEVKNLKQTDVYKISSTTRTQINVNLSINAVRKVPFRLNFRLK